jgi:DNA-binding NarL/FixJ family response regulator
MNNRKTPSLTVPILVADPGTSWWKSAKRHLRPADGFATIEMNRSPSELLQDCRRMAPCLLILSQETLGQLDAVELARVVDLGAAVRVLVVAGSIEPRSMERSVRLGCMGFVREDDPPATLRKAVCAIARGEMWVKRQAITEILQRLLAEARVAKLTPRERDILKLIASGYKNRDIAKELAISYDTVRWYIRSLHGKLGMQDRVETAQYAHRHIEGETISVAAAAAAAAMGS